MVGIDALARGNRVAGVRASVRAIAMPASIAATK
jgi:hypothetical protein